MSVSEMIRHALEQRGINCRKDAARLLGTSPELLRLILNAGHIPKDKTLIALADLLGLDRSALIMAAHREKVPTELQGLFLAPVTRGRWEKKRVWPLSAEQCEYLSKIMSAEEIQIVRKFRQLPSEGQAQVASYIDYQFEAKREIRVPEPVHQERMQGSLCSTVDAAGS